MTTAEARRGVLLGLAIAMGMLAGIAIIVAGAVLGGPWRWVAGVATVGFLALIVMPGFVKDKPNNGIEGEKR